MAVCKLSRFDKVFYRFCLITRRINKNDKGYPRIYIPEHPNSHGKKYVLVHRLIMELKLGRYLNRNEFVHHKNKNVENYDLSNLEIESNSEHMKKHKRSEGIIYVKCFCPKCTEEFVRKWSQIRYKWKHGMQGPFCSLSCSNSARRLIKEDIYFGKAEILDIFIKKKKGGYKLNKQYRKDKLKKAMKELKRLSNID